MTMRQRVWLALRFPPSVESVAFGQPGGGIDGGGAAEVSEGGLVAEPLGVVSDGHEEGAGGVGAHAVAGHEVGGGGGDKGAEDGVEAADFGFEVLYSAGQFAQGVLGRTRRGGRVGGPETGGGGDHARTRWWPESWPAVRRARSPAGLASG